MVVKFRYITKMWFGYMDKTEDTQEQKLKIDNDEKY